MRTGLTKQEKTTDIWFDEKDPLIHIRTHNTDLKKRLLAYSRRYPAICQQMDADPETGCMERSEERRVGKECDRTCRSRWSPYH